jgi:hypothetical protein
MSMRDKIWGTGKKATQEEVVELTNQFYVTLRASFTQIKKEDGNNIRNREAFNRIKVLLEPAQGEEPVQNWTNAYEIEQLLVHLFDDDTIATELAVRLLEARSILRPELAAVYEAHVRDLENPANGGQGANALSVDARRRRLLARLVNDLQWRYIVNEAKRRYSKLITRRTATLSVAALIAFVGAIVMVATRRFDYGDLHLLWVAGLAGTWGATFSMLATVKTRIGESKFDDLKLMKAGSVLLSRAAIGAGAACILFFFLLSGLLAGSAFPSLVRRGVVDARTPTAGTTSPGGTSTTPSASSSTPPTGTSTTSTSPTSTPPTGTPAAPSVPGAKPQEGASTPGGPARAETAKAPPAATTDGSSSLVTTQSASRADDNSLPTAELALLIVWCFIAGFSEQLIPGLLATTEGRAAGPVPSTTDRFRPTTGATQVAPPPTPQTNVTPPQAPASPSQGGAGKAQPIPQT